jgi:hypothetical protein
MHKRPALKEELGDRLSCVASGVPGEPQPKQLGSHVRHDTIESEAARLSQNRPPAG